MQQRARMIQWLVMMLSIAIYFVVVRFVPGGSMNGGPPLAPIFLAVAVGLVVASFVVKNVLKASAAFIVALALCEAAAVLGFVVWVVTGWPYYWGFFVLGLVGQLLHYPGMGD
jgi:hypothetical protein